MADSDSERSDEPAKSDERASRRLTRGLREELTRPGGLGDSAHGLFRRWSRKVWETRGGGLYAVGFALTFLYLELVDIVTDDIPQLVTMNLFSGEPFAFVIQFIVDTIKNTIQAFLWPVTLLQWQRPAGLILLCVGFALFPVWVKPVLERWLFEGEPPPPSRKEQKKQQRRDKKRARD